MWGTNKSHRRGGSTLCAKHDAIIELCDNATLDNIRDTLSDIKDIVEAALEDGQNMEDALRRRKDMCENLEDRIRELENKLES